MSDEEVQERRFRGMELLDEIVDCKNILGSDWLRIFNAEAFQQISEEEFRIDTLPLIFAGFVRCVLNDNSREVRSILKPRYPLDDVRFEIQERGKQALERWKGRLANQEESA